MLRRLLLSSLFLAAAVSAQENYTTWSKYKVVTVTPQSVLGGIVDSFPLLVRLDASSFTGEFANAGAGGASIRFTDSTGTTRLPHQTERFDTAAKKAEFWVRVPRVLTSGAKIRMYWGKSGAADSSNGGKVFNSGFVSAWHLGDSATSGRANAVAGAPAAMAKVFPLGYAPIEGIIGKADTLAGGGGEAATSSTHPWIDLNPTRASYAGFNTFLPGFSYSIWAYDSLGGAGGRYLQLQNDSSAATGNTNNRVVVFRPNPNSANVTVRLGSTNNTQATQDNPLVIGKWQHITVTKAAGLVGMRIYINGRFDTLTNVVGTFTESSPRLWGSIGRSNANTDAYFAGKVDEAELSNVERDSNWVKLSFQTQCNASVTNCPVTSPVALGTTQTQSSGPVAEDYSTWGKHKDITVRPVNALGAPVDSFPLLVRLTAATFAGEFANAGINGASIRFTDSSGTVRLPHQRERFDATAQKAEFWVKVPRVAVGGVRIRMYWSKVGAADSSNGARVFSTANGFGGAWHLGDSTAANPRPNQVTGGPAATLKNFDTTFYSGGYSAREGIIGKADTLVGGVCDAPTLPGRPYLDLNAGRVTNYGPYNTMSNGTGFTWSGWYYDSTNTVQASRYLVAAVDSTVASANGRVIVFRGVTNSQSGPRTITTRWGTNGTPVSTDPAGETLEAAKWQYITVTKAPGNVGVSFYLNAANHGMGTALTSSADANRAYVQVGRSNCATNSTTDTYLSGKVDELQLSTVARDSNWVKLSFLTQCTAPAATGCPLTSIVKIDSLPSYPVVSIMRGIDARSSRQGGAYFAVSSAGGNLSFQLLDNAAGQARLTLVNMMGRKVWAGSFKAGENTLIWNGRASNGAIVPSGIYVARLTLSDVHGENAVTQEKKVPFTR